MNKITLIRTKKGFTYIEVLIALAIFIIVLLPLFPVFAKAGRDTSTAQAGYLAWLAAQEIMLQVKDAAENGFTSEITTKLHTDINTFLENYQEPVNAYGYWVFFEKGPLYKYLSSDAPEITVSAAVSDMLEVAINEGFTIVSVVWMESEGIIGRATGMGLKR